MGFGTTSQDDGRDQAQVKVGAADVPTTGDTDSDQGTVVTSPSGAGGRRVVRAAILAFVGGAATVLLLVLTHGLSGAAPTCSDYWNGGSSGNFATASDWSSGLPTSSSWICDRSSSDVITVTSSATVAGGTLQGILALQSGTFTYADATDTSSIGTFALSGGTFSPTGPVTLTSSGTAASSWTGGTLDGTGTVTVASGAQVNVTGASGTTYLFSPVQVNGTLSVSRTTANNVPLYVYGTCSYDGSITVGSGGAFDLASDDPTNGNPLVQGACGGSGNSVTVQSGGTLAKTGGTGTSTLSGISTTVQGTMNAGGGTHRVELRRAPGHPEPRRQRPALGDDHVGERHGDGIDELELDRRHPRWHGHRHRRLGRPGERHRDGHNLRLRPRPGERHPVGLEDHPNNVPLYVYGTCSYDGSITVGSGGAFDLASDDPTNGNPLVQGALGGSGNSVTVQSGGTLAKTGGTGTSTLSGISTTVQGTMNAGGDGRRVELRLLRAPRASTATSCPRGRLRLCPER